MKNEWKEGLSMGLSIWFLTLLLGFPLGFLQLGYNPRYLLQLIILIVMLVRCCKHSKADRWIGLFTMEALVLITTVTHLIRADSITGFGGIGLWIAGAFFGALTLILTIISVGLCGHHNES